MIAPSEPPVLSQARCLALGGMIAVLTHLWVGWQPLVFLDRVYLPDDTYYTLSIARSIAAGAWPATADGLVTSGFQPMIALLQVPMFWLFEDPDLPVYGTIALSAIFGIGATLLLGALTHRLAGPGAALAAMGLAATAPALLRSSFNGLETTLSGFISLTLIMAFMTTPDRPSQARIAGVGALAGLAIMTRVDTVFLVGLLGLWSLVRFGLMRTMGAAGVAACVASPWIAYCLWVAGTPVPESGSAVRLIIEFHRSLDLTLTKSATVATTIATGLFSPAGPAMHWIGLSTLALAVLIGLARPGVTRLLATLVAGVFAFYMLLLPAYWFFERYFYTIFLASVLLIVLAAQTIAHRVARGSLLASVLLCGAVLWNVQAASELRSQPEATLYQTWEGARGYGEVAQQILAAAPPTARIGALQSGALAYYAGPSQAVLNLDGVVNGAAHRAAKDGALFAYMQAQDLTHFADWPFNLAMLIAYSSTESIAAQLSAVTQAKRQGTDGFILWEMPADQAIAAN